MSVWSDEHPKPPGGDDHERALLKWIVDQGIQVLGGHGFIREHPVEMWYRNSRTLGVLEGTLAL